MGVSSWSSWKRLRGEFFYPLSLSISMIVFGIVEYMPPPPSNTNLFPPRRGIYVTGKEAEYRLFMIQKFKGSELARKSLILTGNNYIVYHPSHAKSKPSEWDGIMIEDGGRYYMSGGNKLGEIMMDIRENFKNGTLLPYTPKINQDGGMANKLLGSSSKQDVTGKRKLAEGEGGDLDPKTNKRISFDKNKGKSPAKSQD